METMKRGSSAFLKMEAEQGYSREDITLATGNNLEAGTVLGKVTATGKYTAYDNEATDGSQTAVGVLLFAVNATASDQPAVAIVRHAIIAKQALLWGAGVTTQTEKDAAIADLQALGITARDVV
jgi:hypothetical protein